MESDLSGKAPDSSTTKLEFTGTTIIPDLTTPSIVTPTSAVPTMIPENVPQHYTVEYLAELVNERKQTSAFSGVFNHTGRLIDEEINRVRLALFQFEFTKEHVVLPAPVGEIVTVTEKVFVPAKSHPEYNFVGRILGPRGMTAKQLEQETSCKVMIRGKGSMRDKKKEDMNRGKPNWEHLSEELHVLIQCEDTKNRCEVKIQRAIEEVRKLLVPAPEGEDELKKKQLMELAIINGTYRTGALQAGIGALGQQALSGGGYGAAAVKSNNNGARMTPTLGNIAPQIRSPTLMQNQLLMQQSAAAQRSTPSAAALAQAHFQAAAMSLANQTGQQQANSMLQAQAQAHLQQSSQGAAEYQMLLNQLQYDPFTNAVALQQQQQQQYAALMLSGANQALLGEYANYEMQVMLAKLLILYLFIHYIENSKLKKADRLNNFLYIKSAYRVSDTQVRFTLIKRVTNKQIIFGNITGKEKKLKIECNSKSCPDPWVPKFDMVGFIGTIQEKFDEQFNETEKIILRKNKSILKVPVVNKIRQLNFTDYPHKLGLCVQPMFKYIHLGELTRFIEMWKENGATKFYFYFESVSHDVMRLLKHYRDNVGEIDVEIIDWALLPNSKDFKDPNFNVYRNEPSLAMSDCLYRSRYVVKYVAPFDLDEVLAVNRTKYQNIIHLLDTTEKINSFKKISSFRFRSCLTQVYKEWKSFEDMRNSKFDNYDTIKLREPFDYSNYAKLIYRPEFIFNFYIHFQVRTEGTKNSKSKYFQHDIDESDAKIHHFRRIPTIVTEPRKAKNSTYYSRLITTLNESLDKNLKNFTLTKEVNEEVEKLLLDGSLCVQVLKKYHRKRLNELMSSKCFKNFDHKTKNVFIKAKQSWEIL
uniref:KH domain-containing protein n=1 Tax=Rhabditophanes sp. KR3021 TaxID=114890 RepID=A0AC35TN99_9BILA